MRGSFLRRLWQETYRPASECGQIILVWACELRREPFSAGEEEISIGSLVTSG